MKNVCIVGYGAIGPIHAEALKKATSANLYAVCDIDPERLALSKEECNVLTYSDFDEMLLDEKIDSVHICTPHYLHFPMIKKALESGKTVVCEKPVTMTRQEYQKLLKLEGSDKVCVILQNRLNVCVEKFKELLSDGSLGKIKTAKAVLSWKRGNEYYRSADWRGKWSTEGGGLLINQAVHTLDFFSYLVGDVKSVNAQMINFGTDEIEVEDTLTAYLGFANGLKGMFFATNAYGDDSSPLFEVICEKGTLRYIDSKLFWDGEFICEDLKPEVGKKYWGSSHENVFVNLYDKGECLTPHDIENTMNTMFAIYESAMSNKKEMEKGVTIKL